MNYAAKDYKLQVTVRNDGTYVTLVDENDENIAAIMNTTKLIIAILINTSIYVAIYIFVHLLNIVSFFGDTYDTIAIGAIISKNIS